MPGAALAAEGKAPVVVAYEGKTLHTFEQVGKSFKMTGSAASAEMPAPPVPILAVSSKGFVQIQLDGKPVWLDRLDVRIEPKEIVNNCPPTVGLDSGIQTYGTNGYGDHK